MLLLDGYLLTVVFLLIALLYGIIGSLKVVLSRRKANIGYFSFLYYCALLIQLILWIKHSWLNQTLLALELGILAGVTSYYVFLLIRQRIFCLVCFQLHAINFVIIFNFSVLASFLPPVFSL